MKRSLLAFLSVFILSVSSVVAYLLLRLSDNLWHSAWIGFCWLLVFLFPLLHWLARSREPRTFQVIFQRAAFLSMGYLSWLLVLTVARDVYLLGIWLWRGQAAAELLSQDTRGLPAFLLAGVFLLGGIFWARFGLRVKRVDVWIEGLAPGLDGLRIAQISDLHIGPTIGKAYVERVVQMVNSLSPDITVLTGDIIDGDLRIFREAAAALGGLEPKGRIFLSPGNHEYYYRFHEWLPVLEKLGLVVLRNQGVPLDTQGGTIWLGGVTDPAAEGFPGGKAPDPALALAGGENAALKILLSHRPEVVQQSSRLGFHLQLSGHTHGGQFFPWTIVAHQVHEFCLGLDRKEKTWIYVSPGTGTWGPPVRFGTTPEVSFLCLRREQRSVLGAEGGKSP